MCLVRALSRSLLPTNYCSKLSMIDGKPQDPTRAARVIADLSVLVLMATKEVIISLLCHVGTSAGFNGKAPPMVWSALTYINTKTRSECEQNRVMHHNDHMRLQKTHK